MTEDTKTDDEEEKHSDGGGDNDEEQQNGPNDNGEEKQEDEQNTKNNDNNNTASSSNRNSTSTSGRRPFPKSFYDPVTNKVMMDPVVHPNGDSLERSVAIEQDPSLAYYNNRALKDYIQQEVERFNAAGSLRGTLLKWNESMRSGWQKLLEKSALPAGEYRPLPDSVYCPISFDLVHEPVIDPDGYTYEKEAITQWILANGDSPVTRKRLSVEQLYNNNALLDALLEETNEESQYIHPSLRRWKHELSTRRQTQGGGQAPPTPTGPSESEPPQTSQRNTYPTSPAELEAERRRRQLASFTMTGAFFLAIVLLLFFPMTFFYFALTFTILLCFCSSATRGDHDR